MRSTFDTRNMSIQEILRHTWGCKSASAIFTVMRLCTSVGVDMILKRGYRLETTITYATLMRPFFRMRFHVPRQQIPTKDGIIYKNYEYRHIPCEQVSLDLRVHYSLTERYLPFWTSVVTIIAHVRLSYTLRLSRNNFHNFWLVIFLTRILKKIIGQLEMRSTSTLKQMNIWRVSRV